jgi:hypothetical protein
MTVGQYVVSSKIIPEHCTMILKDMLTTTIENSMLIHKLLKYTTNSYMKCKKTSQMEIKKIEVNNESLILSLNFICDILSQHNKQLMRNTSDMNLVVGQSIKPMQSIHTPIITVIQNLLNKLPSVFETKDSLLASLETSV